MKIMICYDGKNPSKIAVEKGMALAKKWGAEVLVVSSMYTEDRFHQKEVDTMRQELARIQENAKGEKVRCTTRLSIEGLEPEKDLLKQADAFGAELIVIGIRKRSQVGKLLMGSVAAYIILNSDCPVLAMK
ncbi:MAG: universal stress protein [Desulfobacterales bacterium]